MANTYRPKYFHICRQCGWHGRRARERACPRCGNWCPVNTACITLKGAKEQIERSDRFDAAKKERDRASETE